MIEEILPDDVRAAEAFDDLGPAPLFAEEEALLERAVDKRRAEFATVRACARRALGELGLPPVAVLRGERGEPRWPDGVVGSMTHCAGYRASAVARIERVATIGIDAEPALPLPDRVLDMVSLPQERAQLARLAADRPAVCWDRLLFCAKEAVYKAWFPLAKRWLGFEDAVIEIDSAGTFHARLLVPGPRISVRDCGARCAHSSHSLCRPVRDCGARCAHSSHSLCLVDREVSGFTGRWLARDGLLLAAIAQGSGGESEVAV